jgi:Zn-dependent metalloprotease
MKPLLTTAAILIAVLLTQLASAQGRKDLQLKNYPSLIVDNTNTPRGQAQGIFRKYFDWNADDELKATKSWQDDLGYYHDSYQQYYRKVKVEGAIFIVHSLNNTIRTLSGEFKGIRNLNVNPSISAAQAFQEALNHVGATTYAWDKVKSAYPGYQQPQGELVIIGGSEGDKHIPTLAWKFDIYAATPLYRADVFIDAQTGRFVKEHQRIHTTNSPVSGTTLYNGTQNFTADYTGTAYRLRQTSSGNGIETYSLNNGTDYSLATDITSATNSFTADPASNQAHFGAEKTYAYYKDIHNRNSFDNAGSKILSYVHYSLNYVNAFWDGTRMTYGDGDGTNYKPLVSLDIVGHEITHGVTEYSSNLIYSGESGALNESFSDIFGEAVENFGKGSNDWLMGCDIGVSGCGAFRSMKNPNLYSDPDTYRGTYWYTGTGDNGGVHTNSGVQNKWFYIMVNGESGTNDIGSVYTVTGLGWDKAARITYRSLTVYLTSSSDFYAARKGAIQAAVDLYGAGSPEEIATTNAWYAVGVGCEYGQTCIIPYCTSSGVYQTDEWIAGVKVDTFTNNTGASPYTYFNTKTVKLKPAQSYPITLTPGFTATLYTEYWRIWIDYNNDNDFDDAGEMAYDALTLSSAVRTGTISIPAGVTGTTRMRVSMKYGAAPSPCESFTWGEVEDYPVSFITGPDTLPPYLAPVLTKTSTTTSSIGLSWTAAQDSSGIAGYDVYANGVMKNSAVVTGLTYTITGLTASTTYAVYVRAKDASGNAVNSDTLSITTDAPDTQAPTKSQLSYTNVTDTTVDLNWTVATDNVGVIGYDVYIGNTKKNTSTVAALTYKLTGLSALTSYNNIYVVAKDLAGNTRNSDSVNVTTTDTKAPTAVTVSSPAKTQTTINLSWTTATDNVRVTGYDIYVNSVKTDSNKTTTTYQLANLLPSNNYTIVVRSKDASGNSTPSSGLQVRTMDPVKDTLLKAYLFDGTMESWTSSSTTNCKTVSSPAPYQGTGMIMMQSKNTTATSPALNMSGYSQVEIKFYFKGAGMEAGKKFTVSYNTGSGNSYTTWATFTSGASYSNATLTYVTDELNYYYGTITVNNSTLSSTARIRLTLNGSNTSDIVYFDSVTVRGRKNTTAPAGITAALARVGTPLTIGSTKSTQQAEREPALLRIYPNPVSNLLQVNAGSSLRTIRIFDATCSLVRDIRISGNNATVDAHTLPSGMHVIEVAYEDGRVERKKFIKQ